MLLTLAGSVPFSFWCRRCVGGPPEIAWGSRSRCVCKPGDSRLASWKKVEQGCRLERIRENGQTEGLFVQGRCRLEGEFEGLCDLLVAQDGNETGRNHSGVLD